MKLNLNYIKFTASDHTVMSASWFYSVKVQETTEIQELYTTYKQLYIEAGEDEGVEVKSKSNNSAFVILC